MGISSTFNNGKQKARRVLLLKSKGVDDEPSGLASPKNSYKDELRRAQWINRSATPCVNTSVELINVQNLSSV